MRDREILQCNKMYIKIYKSAQMSLKLNKGNTMYTQFEKAQKQFEELAERIKEVNEFWINSVLSATKEFFNTKKAK